MQGHVARLNGFDLRQVARPVARLGDESKRRLGRAAHDDRDPEVLPPGRPRKRERDISREHHRKDQARRTEDAEQGHAVRQCEQARPDRKVPEQQVGVPQRDNLLATPVAHEQGQAEEDDRGDRREQAGDEQDRVERFAGAGRVHAGDKGREEQEHEREN